MVGAGWTAMILLWSMLGRFCQKAYILVAVVCTRAIGMDDPILVSFCEWAVVHLQVVNLLSGGEFCFNGDKVFFESLFKIGPCTEIWWGLLHGNLLAIVCPFSCWGSEFKMREGGSDFEALVSI